MSFSELGLSKRVETALEAMGFVEPTEIQAKTIPVVLAGRNVMASAETGSGKTAAYALPIIQGIKGSSEKLPRVLVLVPTRELAIQVQSQFDRFSNNGGTRSVTIYGGTGYEKQTRVLRRGVDVVVATPGRLVDHIERRNIDLSNVKTLVLDEADRMLDMGFMPSVRKIIALMKNRSQTLMFSATIDSAMESTAKAFLKDPVRVAVSSGQLEPASIEQKIYHIDEAGKSGLLLELIREQPDVNSVIVFARTRSRVKKIRKQLVASNVRAEEIHGDVSQNKREETLAKYRKGVFSVLVATDVAARGLDIPSISHVVNYDMPQSPQDYVHRIGRTGRAGRTGTALSFVSADQRHLVRNIERVTGKRLESANGAAQPNAVVRVESGHARKPGSESGPGAEYKKRRRFRSRGRSQSPSSAPSHAN
ncbi:MAG: DEAD/DEAH box helicase [Candidatus Melainabacteria bacterium]|nr:DEAD/DEAH box helicase [Candidatus Melainabacteria bacterium]